MTPTRHPRPHDRVRCTVAGQPMDGEVLYTVWREQGDAVWCASAAGDRAEVPLRALRWDRTARAWVDA